MDTIDYIDFDEGYSDWSELDAESGDEATE